MTPEEISGLIEGGETLAVEFKEEPQDPLSDATLVDAVVCLANSRGADDRVLIIGVADDGTVSGARPRHGAVTSPQRLQAMIANQTLPAVECSVELLAYAGRDLIAIHVPDSDAPVGTSSGKYLRRRIGGLGKPECVPYFAHEMTRGGSHGAPDFSAAVVPDATWEDLDPLEFERVRQYVGNTPGSDQHLSDLADLELAKALGAVEADHRVHAIRRLGLLLFGREAALRRLIPTHEVAFQALSGTRVETNDILRLPLLRLTEEMLSRFRVRNQEQEVMLGLRRIGIPDYSEHAFREGLANALVHRDYTRLGAVHLKWQAESLEISSPGGFPEGVNLGNLLVTPPTPRNPSLADAFRRLGLVERTGRGIDTIYLEQVLNGRPPPSYDRSTPTTVILLMPGGEANLDFVRRAIEQRESGRPLNVNEALILHRLWHERRISSDEAAKVIQQSTSDARGVLERLIESGLVEASGSARTREYHLSSGVYRDMGNEAGYVRARGFESIQQEQMVLQLVNQQGRVTRSQTAQLCMIGSVPARNLLAKLVRLGRLERRGRGRGVHYVLPGTPGE